MEFNKVVNLKKACQNKNAQRQSYSIVQYRTVETYYIESKAFQKFLPPSHYC